LPSVVERDEIKAEEDETQPLPAATPVEMEVVAQRRHETLMKEKVAVLLSKEVTTVDMSDEDVFTALPNSCCWEGVWEEWLRGNSDDKTNRYDSKHTE